MPKKPITEKFSEQHPKKDFNKSLEDAFDGTWETFSDNFENKYNMKVGMQTLKKYLEQGIKKGEIKVKLPKPKKRGKGNGKESIIDLFNKENPNKDFNESLKESFDGDWDTFSNNFENKFGVKASTVSLKKYLKQAVKAGDIDIDLPKSQKRNRGKKSIIDKFNEKYPDKDFGQSLKECYNGDFNNLSENFEKKYGFSVGMQTLKKYLIEKTDIEVEKNKKKGKKSFIDKFNEKNDIDFFDAVNKAADGYAYIDKSLYDNMKDKYKFKTSFATFTKYVNEGIESGNINLRPQKKKRPGTREKTLKERISDFEKVVREMTGTQKTRPAVIKCDICGEEFATKILLNCFSLAVFFHCPACKRPLINGIVKFTYKKDDYERFVKNGETIFMKDGKKVNNPLYKYIKADKIVEGWE